MISQPKEGLLVRLRIAEKEDAQFALNLRQDANNTKYMPTIQITLEQQEKWIASQQAAKDSYFFIVERKNGERIGTFSLYNIEGKKAESGRMIIRGTPIETTETVLLFHDFAFFDAGMDMVYSGIEKDNKPAVGVARSVAAVKEGEIEENNHVLDKYVLYKDTYNMSREALVKIVKRFAKRV